MAVFKCVLSRTYNQTETKGSLLVLDGEKLIFKCKTLELPDNGNQKNVSCIPEGKYEVIPYRSPNHGECFKVLNVHNRDNILIHKGNYTKDTQGCILPGMFFTDIDIDGNPDIGDSTTAMKTLLELLITKFVLYIL